jgi:hypothetical protein
MDERVWDDPGPTTADRLMLVSEFERDGHRLLLHEPTFIRAGERYWVDGQHLAIERLSGEVERHAWAWGCR